MNLPAYPRTKPSGVEWLGDVPEHWEAKRSDGIIESEKRQISPESFADEEVFHYSIPAVQEFGTGLVENGESIASAKQVVTEPVILVSRLNPRKATICRAEPKKQRTLASTEFVALKARKCDLRFLEYLVSTELFRQRLDSWVQSVTRSHQRASPELIYRFWNAWPEPTEQRAIAVFLDRETGRIDRLVAKKRELIERLKEKRTALISRTVTRGLPPAAARAARLPENPALKPTGVAWLGDIPVHWNVKPVKIVARIGNGSTPSRDNPLYWEDGDYPWLNSSVVNQEAISGADEFVTALALRECHLPKISPPAVLIGITGQGRTRGMASTLLFEATINQHVAYLKPYSDRADTGFLRRVFDMAYQFLRSESDGGGSTKGAITCEQIANLKIPVPDLPEQAAIAAYVDAETAKLDALVAKVEEAVERLQEYRTALITAAVTGKIDVRQAALDGRS